MSNIDKLESAAVKQIIARALQINPDTLIAAVKAIRQAGYNPDDIFQAIITNAPALHGDETIDDLFSGWRYKRQLFQDIHTGAVGFDDLAGWFDVKHATELFREAGKEPAGKV